MRETMSKGLKYFEGFASELALRGSSGAKGENLQSVDRVNTGLPVSPNDRIIVEVVSTSTEEVEKAALLEIKFKDDSGAVIESSWPHRSSRVGEYKYLKTAPLGEKAVTRMVLDAPESAAMLELQGRSWNRYVRTMVVGEISVQAMNEKSFESTEGTEVLDFPANHLRVSKTIPDGSSAARIAITHSSIGEKSSGPVTVRFRDLNGEELMPTGDLAQHPKFGAYFLLNGEGGKRETTVALFEVPRSAALLEVEGLDWGKKTAQVHGAPAISFEQGPARAINTFLEEIPAGDKLYVIDTTAPPLGHPTLSLRPNNLATQYEKLGIWIIFLPFGTLQEFPARPSDKVLQVPRKDFATLIEALNDRRNPHDSVYICSSFPNFQSVAAGTLLKASGWKIVYECRDDMEEFNRVGYSKWYTQDLERYFLDLADQVVAVSPALLEKLQDMTPRYFEGRVIPNGVSDVTIQTSTALRTPEVLENRNSRQVVGYVGHLTSSWFDWQAVIYAASKLPAVRFQVVGHGVPENLAFPSNVEYLGAKTHEELLEIVPNWRVGLIPFQEMPLTRSVDPNKIYEYFAWGIRCVTSRMGSVEEYPSTWVYSGRDSLVDAIKSAVSTPISSEELQTLDNFVSECSWLNRAEEMRTFIDETELIS